MSGHTTTVLNTGVRKKALAQPASSAGRGYIISLLIQGACLVSPTQPSAPILAATTWGGGGGGGGFNHNLLCKVFIHLLQLLHRHKQCVSGLLSLMHGKMPGAYEAI